MNEKIENAVPLLHQRINVPEGTVLQIYSRDAHGNKMLMSLPGPVDISMVPMECRKIE
jgi:hypothetical protein